MRLESRVEPPPDLDLVARPTALQDLVVVPRESLLMARLTPSRLERRVATLLKCLRVIPWMNHCDILSAM
jgi:hypothetical protein